MVLLPRLVGLGKKVFNSLIKVGLWAATKLGTAWGWKLTRVLLATLCDKKIRHCQISSKNFLVEKENIQHLLLHKRRCKRKPLFSSKLSFLFNLQVRHREPNSPDHVWRHRRLLHLGGRQAALWELETGGPWFLLRRLRVALPAQDLLTAGPAPASLLESADGQLRHFSCQVSFSFFFFPKPRS